MTEFSKGDQVTMRYDLPSWSLKMGTRGEILGVLPLSGMANVKWRDGQTLTMAQHQILPFEAIEFLPLEVPA